MESRKKKDLLLGNLDLLILRALNAGELYGFKIGKRIQMLSADTLKVQKGSLYPALHRLESEGFIQAEWKMSDAEKPMKVYSLTSAGRSHMESEIEHWKAVSAAINGVIENT